LQQGVPPVQYLGWQVEGSQPPVPEELPEAPDEPEELEDEAPEQEPALHVWLDVVQSWQLDPFVPQTVSETPPWQAPVESQQPVQVALQLPSPVPVLEPSSPEFAPASFPALALASSPPAPLLLVLEGLPLDVLPP
jgi:hypothetical protein